MTELLANKYFWALAIPLLLLSGEGIAKSVTQKDPDWKTNFLLGIDLAIAALAADAVNVYELISAHNPAYNNLVVSAAWSAWFLLAESWLRSHNPAIQAGCLSASPSLLR